jgi:phage repressor protein C with HTH and peptisase S24 domain
MSINKRITELINALESGSQRGFAVKTGLSPSYVNSIVGVRGSDPSSKVLHSILIAYTNVNANWLITGEGDRFLSNKDKEGSINIKAVQINKIKPNIKDGIPLIGLDVAAGFGTTDFAINESDIQSMYVVPDFENIDFMIRVKGSSMYPKYSSGDIIACRKLNDSKFIQWNKCYVIATIEQGLLIKRIRQCDKVDFLLAVSDNKEYQPFEIPKTEITGIALVIGVIRLE